jgi:hypothetical protein
MTAALATADLLAALTWDPQVRGFLIFLTSFVILVGSVYLLLATNAGARLGFLLAAAGLTGWCATMGWIWVMYGIGIRGDDPHWEVKEVVTGDVAANSAIDETENFPQGWEQLEDGNPILGDATAAADAVLLGESGEGGHGGGEAAAAPAIPALFESAEDFVHVGGYRTGGEDYWIPGGYLERNQTPFRGWLHQPHFAVVQVQPVIEQPDVDGAPAEPRPDTSQPVTTVVMERNLGNLRQPSMFFAVANTIAFAVFCVLLHRRDKAIMAMRNTGAATATA